MDFGFYYNPIENQIRGGYWPSVPPGPGLQCRRSTTYRLPARCGRRQQAGFTCHHYGAFNTEPRIASYIGIAYGQIPAAPLLRRLPHVRGHVRLELAGDEADRRVGGVHGRRRGRSASSRAPTSTTTSSSCRPGAAVPSRHSWCRSSCPRSSGARAAGASPTRCTRSPRSSSASGEARYGYWGFSPASDPAGGYREYGVDCDRHGAERLFRRRPAPDADRTRAGTTRRAPVSAPTPIDNYGAGRRRRRTRPPSRSTSPSARR